MALLESVSFGPMRWDMRWTERVIGALLVAAGILGFLFNRTICRWEAVLNQQVLSWTQLVDDPRTIGAAVIFHSGDRYIGLMVTPGCSVVMLLAPFMFLTAVLLWIRRGEPRVLGIAMASLAVLFVLTNQIRLGAVAFSMDQMGLDRGYELSHVTLGSIISALGFVIGIVVFAWVLTRDGSGARGPKRKRGRRA